MKSNLKETDYELLKDEALQCNIGTDIIKIKYRHHWYKGTIQCRVLHFDLYLDMHKYKHTMIRFDFTIILKDIDKILLERLEETFVEIDGRQYYIAYYDKNRIKFIEASSEPYIFNERICLGKFDRKFERRIIMDSFKKEMNNEATSWDWNCNRYVKRHKGDTQKLHKIARIRLKRYLKNEIKKRSD